LLAAPAPAANHLVASIQVLNSNNTASNPSSLASTLCPSPKSDCPVAVDPWLVAAGDKDRCRSGAMVEAGFTPPAHTSSPKATQVHPNRLEPPAVGSNVNKLAARVLEPSTTRGRPRELNPHRSAALLGCGRAPPASAVLPTPSDGSVASDPLVVVATNPVCGRMGWDVRERARRSRYGTAWRLGL
jgi:hypothetical protein